VTDLDINVVQDEVAGAEAKPFQTYTNASGFAAFLHQRLGQLLSTIQVSPALQPLQFTLHHLCACTVG